MLSTRTRSLTRWSPGTVAIMLSSLYATPRWCRHGKRGAKLLGTRALFVPRWTSAMPTSLAELLYKSSRRDLQSNPSRLCRPATTLNWMTDEPEDFDNDNEVDEIEQLRATPV